MFSAKFRIYRDKDGLWIVEEWNWYWPFWYYKKCCSSENKAREIVAILKQKPIYL